MAREVRQAHALATRAVRTAEAAARAAGVEVEPHVVDQLTVKRIRVVEDDGTLRLMIGNGSVVRAIPMRGVEHPGRLGADLLFVNGEGTECPMRFGEDRWGQDPTDLPQSARAQPAWRSAARFSPSASVST